MPHYFQNIPTVNYDIGIYKGVNPTSNTTYASTNAHEPGVKGTKNIVSGVQDITRRYALEMVIASRKATFFDYSIQEGETAQMIAHKLYGDVTLEWIVYLTNQIHDPYYDWPMDTYTFETYIRSKYGSLRQSQENVYAYYQILNKRKTLPSGNVAPEKKIEVDQTTYNGLSTDWRTSLTNYDWEIQENERKRLISLLGEEYIPDVLKRIGRLYNGV